MKSKRVLPLVAASMGLLAIAAFAGGQGRPSKSSPKGAITVRRGGRSTGATIKGDSDPRATFIANQAERTLQLNADQGTKISVRPDAKGAERASQMKIADRFAEQQPAATRARIDHFSWLNDPEVRCNGWYAGIQAVVGGGDHARVEICVSPILMSEKAMSLSTPYYVVETYELNQGTLSLISVEAPPPGTLKALIQD